MARFIHRCMKQPESGSPFFYHLIACSFRLRFVSRPNVWFCFIFRLAEYRASVMDDSGLREGRLFPKRSICKCTHSPRCLLSLIWVKGVWPMKTQQRTYYLYFFFSKGSPLQHVILEKSLYLRNKYESPAITVISVFKGQKWSPHSHVSRSLHSSGEDRRGRNVPK